MKATIVHQGSQSVLTLIPETDQEAAQIQDLHIATQRQHLFLPKPYTYMEPEVKFVIMEPSRER